jgi:GNAT superfamily N-acetyltransferase
MRLTKVFTKVFDWHGHSLKIGSVLPEYREQIQASLSHMSKESIRHRFFSQKNGFSNKELKYLTEIDGLNHFAYGIVENDGAERGVAIIRMVRDEELPQEAEVAISIIDDYQKIGIGSLLMNFCLVAASERNIDVLRFTYLPDNTGIIKLIRRFGQFTPKPLQSDYVQIKIQLTPDRIAQSQSEIQDFFK